LQTGDPEVDNQHRALYVLVNDLNADALIGGDRTMASKALARILEYATTHFATEERLMVRTSYPDAEHHVAAHREFAREATELVEAHDAGHGKSLRDLAEFMENWLETHIGEEDKRLIHHVRASRGL
jgi:hemerythrin-like metal-binding protein